MSDAKSMGIRYGATLIFDAGGAVHNHRHSGESRNPEGPASIRWGHLTTCVGKDSYAPYDYRKQRVPLRFAKGDALSAAKRRGMHEFEL